MGQSARYGSSYEEDIWEPGTPCFGPTREEYKVRGDTDRTKGLNVNQTVHAPGSSPGVEERQYLKDGIFTEVDKCFKLFFIIVRIYTLMKEGALRFLEHDNTQNNKLLPVHNNRWKRHIKLTSNIVSSQKLTKHSNLPLSPPSFTILWRKVRLDSCKIGRLVHNKSNT